VPTAQPGPHAAADRRRARRAIQRALAEVVLPDAEELVQLELLRLDALTCTAWRILEAEHILVSAGRLVYGPTGRRYATMRPPL
jgi:hypothetical protein